MLRFDRLPTALALTLAMATSLWLTQANGAETPVLVPTLKVQRGSSASVATLDGSLQPVKQSTVAAQVGGTVVALLVKVGDTVRAGQALARLDPREVQAGLARTDAAVAQAQAELSQARQNANRTRDLRAQGFVSEAALDLAATQLAAAQAGAAQAQAAQRQAALISGHADVTAPYAGVVLATLVEVGDLAVVGRPLLTLYQPGALRAVVQVPVSRALIAQSAQEVSIELPDGRLLMPTARQPLPSTDPVSQTVEWRLPLSAADSAVGRPGQSVRVHFRAPAAAAAGGRDGALDVPASAVLRRGELSAVYIVDNGQFALRPVRTGASSGDRVELLAGVQAGQVIARDAVRAGLLGARPAAGAEGAK
jgi:RND family efflux transporter MFP subunit